MMKRRLYIDGQDVYTEYGVYVTSGGWNELIAMPPLKTVDSNDWPEEDGIEPDLTAPVLNSREINISFAVSDINGYLELVKLLSDGAYHTFDCTSIGRMYRLRFVSTGNLDYFNLLSVMNLKFADDFPLLDYNYISPLSSVPVSDDYTIDGVNFTDYGVRILKGTLTEVVKTPPVKTRMLRNIRTITGAIYDDSLDTVRYKSNDVKLSCLMRANTLSELWRNYDALLYDLIRPDERLLRVGDLEAEFPCHYKDCSVSEFYPEDKIWLKFSITLTFTRDFIIDDFDILLASENFEIIITETDDYSIDLQLIKEI